MIDLKQLNLFTLAELNGKTSDATLIDTADSRLSDSRIPTGTAGGDLTGVYPDPTVVAKNRAALIDWDGDATGPIEVTVEDMGTIELPDGAVKGVIADHIISSIVSLSIDPILTVRFVINITGGASQNVVLRLIARYIASGELVTKAADQTLTNTVSIINTANQLHTTTFTLDRTLLAASDNVTFHLERLGTDGADDFTGAIGIEEHSRIEALAA